MDEGKAMEKPKVSIIVPTYNSGETLSECLESVHRQRYPLYEVIVVDNFSSDGTIRIATERSAKITQQRSNPASARNIGVANSTGKYVLFLDSDQALSPPVIEECVRECENGGFGMVRIPEIFLGKKFWDSCAAAWKNCYYMIEQRQIGEQTIRGEPRFFVKREVIRAGMLNANLLWGENYDLYNRLDQMNVRETSCSSKIHHYEPTSVRKIVAKDYRYGKSMPAFMQHTQKQVFRWMFRRSLLTLGEVLRNFRRSPAIICGCTVLLGLKTYSIGIGLLVAAMSN